MTLIDVSSSELTTAILAIFLVAMLLAVRGLAARAAAGPIAQPAVRWARDRIVAKLSSKGLAALIVDALVESKVLPPEKSTEALEIAARRIDLRKALGDY